VPAEPGRPAPAAGGAAGGWDVPWTWLDPVVVFLVGLVLAEIIRALLGAALPATALEVVGPLVGGLTLIAVVAGWLALRHPADLRRVLGPGPLRAAVVAKGAGHGAVAFVVLNLGVAALFALVADTLGFELPPVQESLRETITDPRRAAGGLVYALSVAVVAEELVFRGLLFPALRGTVGRWRAIGLVGAAFGFVHYQPDPLAWAYTGGVMVIFGAYLAWAFDRYRHLAVALAMHATFNVLAVVAILQAWE
jgi:membrane protease YdiL (CAAX protease family)